MHRDLKSFNTLFNANETSIINDLGLGEELKSSKLDRSRRSWFGQPFGFLQRKQTGAEYHWELLVDDFRDGGVMAVE